MKREHNYQIAVRWTGNTGKGTESYRSYSRNHVISVDGKPDILGSSDPAFLGDKSKYNPEQIFVATLSACHMLWYLHLCSDAGIVIVEYIDQAIGIMDEEADGKGHFREVTLNPEITITDPSKQELAKSLHAKANEMCFIANSVKFPVYHKPVVHIGVAD